MSSAVTTAGQEIKAVPQGAVGGPLHTVILVMLRIGGDSLMYFSGGTRKHATAEPRAFLPDDHGMGVVP